MQNNRATMFLPFDALKGFKEALEATEILVEKNFEEQLIYKINQLEINDFISIKYFTNINFITTKGLIKKIDYKNKMIYVSHTEIKFEDIIDIQKL